MFEQLEQWDKALFLALNGFHNSFFDALMPQATKPISYVPLYAIVLYFLFKEYGKKIWLIVLSIILLVFLADQSANKVKNSVKRYRPSHNTELKPVVHIVDNYRGGQYGYLSGHAANTFAIATFLSLLFRRKKWYIHFAFFSWAAWMTYTRIYLGVHYPFDIISGALLGIVLAFVVFYIFRATEKNIYKLAEN